MQVLAKLENDKESTTKLIGFCCHLRIFKKNQLSIFIELAIYMNILLPSATLGRILIGKYEWTVFVIVFSWNYQMATELLKTDVLFYLVNFQELLCKIRSLKFRFLTSNGRLFQIFLAFLENLNFKELLLGMDFKAQLLVV